MTASQAFVSHASTGSERPTPLLLRFRVFLTRAGLDSRIARGEAAHERGPSPDLRPELALRGEQLARPAVRRGLAQGLRNVLDAADEPVRGLSATPPLNRRGLRMARDAMLDLAASLEAPSDVAPRGVAMTACLLREGDSPLYLAVDADELRAAVAAAREALV